MSKKSIIYSLIFLGIWGYSQSEKVVLSNLVEVEFIEEKRKGTKIVLDIEKTKCFQDLVGIEAMDEVLEDYSKRSSYTNNEVRFLYDKIEYETTGGYEKAVIDVKNIIQYFNIGSARAYLAKLTQLSKKHAVKRGEIIEHAVNKKYPDYSYPLLEKNITSKSIHQLSEEYKKAIGVNNIKMTIFGGKGKETHAEKIEILERIFKQLNLKKVNLNCEKVNTSNSFLVYKPFLNIKEGIHTHSIYTQEEKINPTIEKALNQTFGDENVKVHVFDNFSEIHISQKTKGTDGKALLEKLKVFANNNQLDYKKFGTVVSGDVNGVYKGFKDEDITYLNIKNDTIVNPFVYKKVDLTGKEIIDQYLDAVGDRKLIESIHNTRARYDVILNRDTLDLKVLFLNELPYRKLRKMILDDEEISYNIFDGRRGWINKVGGVIVDYSDEEIAQALAEETVFPQQFYAPSKIFVEGLVVEENENHTVNALNKIKISSDNYTIHEYYNPDTKLLMKREFCKEAHVPIKTVYYGSYAKLKDLMIPHRLRIVENNQELRLTLASYSYNSFVSSDEFSKKNRFNFKEENFIDRFEKLEKTKTRVKEEAVVKNGEELSNPFEGIDGEKLGGEEASLYDESQYRVNENRTRVIKYLLVLARRENETGADVMLKELKKKGFDQAYNIEMNDYHYTIEGAYATEEEAHKRLNEVSKKNKGTWILKREQ
ncbi:MAG: hypothetical protein ACK5HU_01740 [Flavobacteriales bacterium]